MTREEQIRNLQVPDHIIDMVLDTDTYNEIDDQFAISFMLRSPERINVLGFTAAPYFNAKSTGPADGMEKSYDEIIKLLKLAGREELIARTYRGSKEYLPDEKTPVDSPAAHFLAELADGYSAETPLYIAAIGAFTNVASAFLMNPAMKDKVVLILLGGNAPYMPPMKEFNLSQDIAAGRVLFGSGAPVVQLPCAGCVDRFVTDRYELEHWLVDKNPLADYLARNTIEEAESYASGTAWTRVIWDVTTVGWLLNDGGRYMKDEIIPTELPTYDNSYEQGPEGEVMRRVYWINRDELFTALFRKLV